MAEREEKMKLKVLQALRNAGKAGMINAELSQVALRYGGYLGTLYQEGYDITSENIGNGVWRYTLISEPKTIVKREKAWDVLAKKAEEAGIKRDVLISLFNDNGITVRYVANTYKK